MKLVQFTRTLPAGVLISINPMNVVAVSAFNNYTQIHVASPNQNGVPYHFDVIEKYPSVVASINGALGG